MWEGLPLSWDPESYKKVTETSNVVTQSTHTMDVAVIVFPGAEEAADGLGREIVGISRIGIWKSNSYHLRTTASLFPLPHTLKELQICVPSEPCQVRHSERNLSCPVQEPLVTCGH